VSKLAAFRSG